MASAFRAAAGYAETSADASPKRAFDELRPGSEGAIHGFFNNAKFDKIAQKTGFFPHSNEIFSKIAIIQVLHPSLYVRTRPGKYRNRSKLVPVKPVLDSDRGTGIGETVKC
jgi:hypothetical protein